LECFAITILSTSRVIVITYLVLGKAAVQWKYSVQRKYSSQIWLLYLRPSLSVVHLFLGINYRGEVV